MQRGSRFASTSVNHPDCQIRCAETEELESTTTQVGDARTERQRVLVCLPRFV
jgi:hypothetical protein